MFFSFDGNERDCDEENKDDNCDNDVVDDVDNDGDDEEGEYVEIHDLIREKENTPNGQFCYPNNQLTASD